MTIVLNPPATFPVPPGEFISIGLSGPPWGTITFVCKDCAEGATCPGPIDCDKDSPNGKVGPIPDCADVIAQCPGHPDKPIR